MKTDHTIGSLRSWPAKPEHPLVSELAAKPTNSTPPGADAPIPHDRQVAGYSAVAGCT